MTTVMLRFHVTGKYDRRNLDFYVDAGNREAGQPCAAAYLALTGKNLRHRRREWHCTHERGKPISFVLIDGDITHRITIEAIGRADTKA